MVGCGSLNVESQSGIGDSLAGGRSEGSDTYVFLLELREVLQQRMYAGGAEEDEHIVVEALHFFLGQVVADGTIHDALGVVELALVEQVLQFVSVDAAHGYKVFFTLVLDHHGHKVLHLSGGTIENLALAVLHIFLYVKRNRFGDTEILHRLGNRYHHLFGYGEEMIDGMTRSKDNS